MSRTKSENFDFRIPHFPLQKSDEHDPLGYKRELTNRKFNTRTLRGRVIKSVRREGRGPLQANSDTQALDIFKQNGSLVCGCRDSGSVGLVHR